MATTSKTCVLQHSCICFFGGFCFVYSFTLALVQRYEDALAARCALKVSFIIIIIIIINIIIIIIIIYIIGVILSVYLWGFFTLQGIYAIVFLLLAAHFDLYMTLKHRQNDKSLYFDQSNVNPFSSIFSKWPYQPSLRGHNFTLVL